MACLMGDAGFLPLVGAGRGLPGKTPQQRQQQKVSFVGSLAVKPHSRPPQQFRLPGLLLLLLLLHIVPPVVWGQTAAVGNVTTLAGSSNGGLVDGVGTAALFFEPHSIAVDSTGAVAIVVRLTMRGVKREAEMCEGVCSLQWGIA